MIRFTRTAVVAGGHVAEATGFAAKVTALVNARYGDTPLRWGMQIGGTVGTLHWTMDLPDLAALERITAELSQDGEYTTMVDASGGMFVPGRTHDAIVSLLG